MGTQCKKCGYERKPSDTSLATECPKCGALYAKVEQYLENQKIEKEQKIAADKKKLAAALVYIGNTEPASHQEQRNPEKQVIVKTYVGSQANATKQFQDDAIKMAAKGYVPTSQSWAPGAYGCGSFLFALLLCFLIVGFLVFIYMLLVKPDGTLSVTYELRTENPAKSSLPSFEEKTCPKCAEQVKAAAQVCRFCGYSFINAE